MSVADRRRQGGATAVDSSLGNLSLSQSSPAAKASSKAQANVADSWEDESSSSEPTTPVAEPPSSALHPHPQAPPPTPASPSASFENPYALPTEFPSPSGRPRGDRTAEDGKRPEKTTSTASRMIAGALGVKAPRKGEEMRAYEKASMEKEKARREQERSEKEEEEQRKKSVWED